MNFTMDASTMNQISKNMGSLLGAKTTIPVLTGVLTVVQENEILFTVSDGADTLVQRVMRSDEVEINTTGTTILPKDFFTTVRKMRGQIEVCTEGNIVTVTKGKTELSFTTMIADEYPKIAEQAPLSQLRYSGPTFKKIVESTAFCAATSETRPVLTGVNLKMEGKQQTFVSTDSHRLGNIHVLTSDCLEENTNVNQTIPASALTHAAKTFDLSKDVFVVNYKNMVAFVNGNVIYYSRLIEGNFPDTSRLIPQQFSTELTFNKNELRDTVQLLKEASQDSVVKFVIDESLFVKISAKNELAKGNAEVAYGEKIGEDLTISFSSQYFLEALNAIENEIIKISFCGAMRPFVIRSSDENDTSLQLILPVRTY